MKVRELLIEFNKSRSLRSIIKYRRPRYAFTRFIVDGYLSFIYFSLDESYEPRPKNNLHKHSSGKEFNNKVKFMRTELNKLIEKTENYCKDFPQYIEDYKFPQLPQNEHRSREFVKEFKKFYIWINENYKIESYKLQTKLNSNTLTERNIKDFNEYNKSINDFNKILDFMYDMFNNLKNNDDGLLFNDDSNKFIDILLLDPKKFKLKQLVIPKTPKIIETYNPNTDGDIETDY